jgi:hypothetical protein
LEDDVAELKNFVIGHARRVSLDYTLHVISGRCV